MPSSSFRLSRRGAKAFTCVLDSCGLCLFGQKTKQTKAPEAPKGPAPWTTEEEAWLSKAMVKIPAGTRQRWKEVADYMVQVGKCARRTGKECVSHAEKLKKAELLARSKKSSAAASSTAAANNGTVDAVAAAKAAAVQATATDWTTEQQKRLEAAMAQFPSTMEKKARWKAIADAVEGKTAKECVARVKAIKAQLLAQSKS